MRNDTALLVGFDHSVRNCLGDCLQSLGLDLFAVSSAHDAKRKLCERKFDLLLIQFEPIRKQIFDLCSFTRVEHCEALILVLMAKVMPLIESKLFERGVDDIVAGKQTLPAVLRSRIKRRLVGRSIPLASPSSKITLKGGTIVDLERREVRGSGFPRRISGVSQKLLQYFIDNPDRAVSREELIKSYIWDNSVCLPDKTEQGKAVDMAVTRLRRIIEPDPSNPQIITTIQGIGWILAEDAVQCRHHKRLLRF